MKQKFFQSINLCKLCTMNIVLVAATAFELEAFKSLPATSHNISLKVHEIGMMAATFHLQQIAAQQPDLIIQCGIAGSYHDHLAIGETVVVANDTTDIGAENQDHLLSLFDLNLQQADQLPFVQQLLPCPFLNTFDTGLQKVNALSVNCASGTALTIQKRKTKYHASIETMEGAALHYVGLMTQTPFLQIKTISNLVTIRNRADWDVALALANNATEIKKIITTL